VRIYLESTAVVKLVNSEPESPALRRFLRSRAEGRVTSALARVEVVRAVAGRGTGAVAHARRQLERLDQIAIDRNLLDEAATLLAGTLLRSLDAIHLASAGVLGSELRVLVTYDQRMASAAEALGMPVDAPR
jgi:predicted nucleic acid-binding protein